MKNIKYLRIGFGQKIWQEDIPKFRAAVIEKTERQASLFHNHQSDTKVIYRYPLIQYKIIDNQASIVCLNKGATDIHFLLRHSHLDLRIGEVIKSFPVESIDLHQHELKVDQEAMHTYRIKNWLALNQKYYQLFQELARDSAAQVNLLKSILIGNILSAAKGLNWYVEDEIKVEITQLTPKKNLLFKKEKFLGFSATFTTNVTLPSFIGLGKGSSIGFGILEKTSTNHKN